MNPPISKQIAVEACNALDAMTTLGYDFECHAESDARRAARETRTADEMCEAMRNISTALKNILRIAEKHGGNLIPVDVVRDAAVTLGRGPARANKRG
jgi:hypothetical protein